MRRRAGRAIGVALVIVMGGGVPNAAAQADRYPAMAPIDQYLMERGAEVQLARSAAPDALSRDATILVLGRHGYETAVQGTNGLVCMVGRSWLAAFDWPEFWNPRVRAADCMNPQAARAMVPIAMLRSRMVMAGRSKGEILAALKAAFGKRQLPDLESGAMDYMMSPSSWLADAGDHNTPHVMFFAQGTDAAGGDAGVAGSPVVSVPFWFFSSSDPSQMDGLPPIRVFLVMVPAWSDGTPAGRHDP